MGSQLAAFASFEGDSRIDVDSRDPFSSSYSSFLVPEEVLAATWWR